MIEKLKKKLGDDKNLNELLTGSAVTFVIKIFGMGIGYIVVLVISRMFGSEGVGIYSMTLNLLMLLAILGSMGMNVAVLRYVGQYAKSNNGLNTIKIIYKYIIGFSIPFSIIIALLLFLFSHEISVNIFGNKSYIPAMKMGAIVLPFLSLNLIGIEFIRGLKKLRISEFLRSISRQLVVLILIALPLFNYDKLNGVIALVIGIFCTFLMTESYILKYLRVDKSDDEDMKIIVTRYDLFKTSIPMMITTISYYFLANSGGLFIESLSSTSEVGIFNVCLQLSMLISLILNVVNTVSAPKFAELFWKGEKVELQKVIDNSNKIIFVVSIITSILMIVFCKFILSLYGKEFINGALSLIILIAGQLINAWAGSTGTFLNMCGYQVQLRNITVISSVVTATLFFILIPALGGVLGASIAIFFGQTLYNLSSTFYILNKSGLRTFFNPIGLLKKIYS